jgi:hypothetical protein
VEKKGGKVDFAVYVGVRALRKAHVAPERAELSTQGCGERKDELSTFSTGLSTVWLCTGWRASTPHIWGVDSRGLSPGNGVKGGFIHIRVELSTVLGDLSTGLWIIKELRVFAAP